MQPVMELRRDVDWLRAIAVIVVIGFHFEIPGFRGGFVGVDIFFVISGLLIGRIIQSEMAAGTFSFLTFYERRIRRLIPALYAMLLIVALVGGDVLFGSERADLLRSILGVATFTSNIVFWSQSGYFDRAATEKPLLHTWSLGIEEQFYIVLPLALWLLLRWRSVVVRRGCIAALAVCSFAISQWLLHRDAAGAFFLLQSRAWELLAGVMLTWLPVMHLGRFAHILRVVGLALIVIAVMSYTPRTAFPGLNALLPVSGAVLFLSAGPSTLRMRPVELIGQMSYSLYLWHWPVFTLAKLSSATQTVEGAEKLPLLALLGAVASASYFWLERPARYAPVSRKAVFASAAAATAVLIVAGAIGPRMISTDVSDSRIVRLNTYEALTEVRRPGGCFTEDWGSNQHAECFAHDGNKQAALVWGDSLADHYVGGLKGAAPQGVALLQANAAGCFPTFKPVFKQYDFCDALAERVRHFAGADRSALLVISADWVGYTHRAGQAAVIANLKETVAAAGVPVVVIGPSVQFKGRLPSILIRSFSRDAALPASADVMLAGLSVLDREMKSALSGVANVTYVSAMDAICPNSACPLIVANGAPLTWDHGHLTREGSDYAAAKMAPEIFSRKVAAP